MTPTTEADVGFDQAQADEISRIRKHTIPIEITKEMLTHALKTVEEEAGRARGLELDVRRLQRELIALHRIIEERDASIEALQVEMEAKIRESQEDPLTGLYLRRIFEQLCNQDLALAKRRSFLKAAEDGKLRVMSAVSVLMFDIDHFKAVNDTHGHLVGDLVLKGVTDLLKKAYREIDVICRWGGEEIAVYLPMCPVRMATGRTLEVCHNISRLAFEGKDGKYFHVTVTVGVAHLISPEDTLETLLGRADRALYAGKGGGRNRVVIWQPVALDGEEFIPIMSREHLDQTPVP